MIDLSETIMEQHKKYLETGEEERPMSLTSNQQGVQVKLIGAGGKVRKMHNPPLIMTFIIEQFF